jgi:hypothetical protein
MKPQIELGFFEPADPPVAEKNAVMDSEISGYIFHPVRRASDNCPLTRVPFGSEYPPTSPKIHELRERNAAQLVAETRLRSSISK